MDSQEETVNIQLFEIGIHKDLPIEEIFFLGGGELRSTFERFSSSFFSWQIEASIGGRGKNAG